MNIEGLKKTLQKIPNLEGEELKGSKVPVLDLKDIKTRITNFVS